MIAQHCHLSSQWLSSCSGGACMHAQHAARRAELLERVCGSILNGLAADPVSTPSRAAVNPVLTRHARGGQGGRRVGGHAGEPAGGQPVRADGGRRGRAGPARALRQPRVGAPHGLRGGRGARAQPALPAGAAWCARRSARCCGRSLSAVCFGRPLRGCRDRAPHQGASPPALERRHGQVAAS